MSILIRGMEMPKDCRECRLKYYSFAAGDTWCEVNYAILAKSFKAIEFDGKPDSCPLVEVPTPHGALIDTEEFKKALDERFDEMRNKYPGIRFGPGWMLAGSVILHSPTVIEAEGKDED